MRHYTDKLPGKTTFVNTLCEQNVIEHKDADNAQTANVELGLQIQPVNLEVESEGLRIGLTIVDTPGFGDSIDNEYMFNEILGFIERQYDDILSEESRIRRNPRFRDNRVHALVYFIAPTGHSLREMDIEFMRRLSPRVNVIPVIGKSDTMTPSELFDFASGSWKTLNTMVFRSITSHTMWKKTIPTQLRRTASCVRCYRLPSYAPRRMFRRLMVTSP